MQRSIGNKMLMFIVVIIAFQDVAAGVAGSIMADIIKAFPDYDPTIVMLVATFPGLMQIIPALSTENYQGNLISELFCLQA